MRTITAFCLLPLGLAAAQTSMQSVSQQLQARQALERSERHIAAAQAAQMKEAQERADQQRRAQVQEERKRAAEEREMELLVNRRALAQQSNAQLSEAATPPPAAFPQTSATVPVPDAVEAQPSRYRLLRQTGVGLMIGSSLAALMVLWRIARQWWAA